MSEIATVYSDSLAQARGRWRAGRYRSALTLFATAARGGDEASIVALIRAFLALGYDRQAAEVVDLWARRRPDYANVCAYQVLMAYAHGGLDAALPLLQALPKVPAFCAAVHRALHRLRQHRDGQPIGNDSDLVTDGSWAPALDGLDHLLTAGVDRWFTEPVGLLRWAASHAPSGGITAECGVFWGRSIRLLAALRDQVHGFDSFAGLPSDWKAGEAAGAYSTGGQLPLVPPNVLLYRGWFEDTIAPFVAEQHQPLDLLHVDCDLYASTQTVLDHFQPMMRRGTLIVFDDYMGYDGWRDHEHRAWLEFCERTGTAFCYRGGVLLGREVVVEITCAPT